MAMYKKTVALKGGWKLRLRAQACPPHLLKTVEDALLSPKLPEGFTSIKSSSSSRVYKFFCGEDAYVFKEFLSRNVFEPVKALINGVRAERAWKGGDILTRKDFLTPPMFLSGVKSKWGVPSRNFLVTGFISGFCGLATFLKDRFNSIPPKERFYVKRRIASALGETVGRLHSEGIIHGDLRLDNIMIPAIESGGGELKFYFIDNERNSVFKEAPLKLIIKNLVQVSMVTLPCVSSSDRMRFFCAYLSGFPAIVPMKKELAREVFRVTSRRLKAKHGKGF